MTASSGHAGQRDDRTSAVPARYYENAGAPPLAVSVLIRERIIVVTGAVQRSAPLGTVRFESPTPSERLVRFSDGAWLAVTDAHGFDAMLAADGGAASGSQWEGGPRALLIVLAVLLVCAVALYEYGVPVAARAAAAQIPADALDAVSRDAVAALDQGTFEPSRLPPERQERLTRAFRALVGRQQGDRYALLFRRSPSIGPNAMALPSGTIVITDELVNLARDERELLGVLAHEAGHIEGRHGVRLIFQNSALALLAAWLVGDVTSLMTVAPTTLLQAKYSRDFERESDAYAADLLRARGISPARLADLLERMEQAQPGSSSVVAYVSSHPATPERLEYLRAR